MEDSNQNNPGGEERSMKPEREALKIDSSGIKPEDVEMISPLLESARKKLWRWKTFPIVLPESNTLKSASGESDEDKKTISFRDPLILPDFDELDEVSMDSEGNQRRLDDSQLESIWKTGEFEVESVRFPGQKHTWRLSQLMQKGSERSTQTLRKDLARALTLLVVVSREWLIGDIFSVKRSLLGWKRWFKAVLDSFIGLRSMVTKGLAESLALVREEHLVSTLTPEQPESGDRLAEFFRKQINKSSNGEGQGMDDEKKPMINVKGSVESMTNYIFEFFTGKADLRLCSREVMKKAKSRLEWLVDEEPTDWWVQFKEDTLKELQEKDLDDDSLELETEKRLRAEHLQRLTASILKDKELNAIGDGIPQLFVDQLRAGLLFYQAKKTAERNIKIHRNKIEEQLKADHPILSQIEHWMERRIDEAQEEYLKVNRWEAHKLALEYLDQAGLQQHRFFLIRDIDFLEEQYPIQQHILSEKLTSPAHTFTFKTKIWRPKKWKVTQTYKGRSEVIPTVIHQHVGKPSDTDSRGSDAPEYEVERETTSENSTKNPFWRWGNFFKRTWSWFCNYSFTYLVIIPWCSALSFRSLLCLEPFYPDLEVSQKDGSLHKKESSKTETIFSRVKAIWNHVAEARARFESQPDRGFLGKALLRHFNRFSNYVVKGFIGTLITIIFLPILCILVSGGSLVLALLGPVIVPVFSLVAHLLGIVLYDFETNSFWNAVIPNIFWNILVLGILQPLISLGVSFVVCPLTALILAVFAVSRKTTRKVWDTVMYFLFIWKRAKVPSENSFVVRRTAGPGMASRHFYQIKAEQALIALEAQMERQELCVFEEEMKDLINSPLEEYKSFITTTMKPFGVCVDGGRTGVYKNLDDRTDTLLNTLESKVTKRKEQLRIETPDHMIKMTENELKVALGRGVEMVKEFYPNRVIKRTKGGAKKFWEEHDLRSDDWIGLTSHLYSITFFDQILTPLQEADTAFRLQLDNWNITGYLNMVMESNWHDDLDVAKAVHTPKQNLSVSYPYMDSALFDPMDQFGRTDLRSLISYNSSRSDPDPMPGLCIPLPLLPTPIINIVHYNRTADEPLDLEDCRRVLRDLQEKEDNDEEDNEENEENENMDGEDSQVE